MKILCINIDNTINEIDIKEFKSINCLSNLTDSKGWNGRRSWRRPRFSRNGYLKSPGGDWGQNEIFP